MINRKNTKVGDVLSEIQHYRVTDLTKTEIEVVNERNEKFWIENTIAENGCNSATEFNEEIKVTRTEIIDIFLKSSRIAMTVVFNKQKKESEAKKELYALYAKDSGKIISKDEYKKNVNTVMKTIFKGEERVMTGRHYGNLDERGRMFFIDMKQPNETVTAKDGTEYDKRQRLVDGRTITSLIVDNIRYIVK